MIYISSSSIKSESIESCVNELVSMDIRNIELSGGVSYSANMKESLKDLKNKYALNYLIHNYFPPPKESFVLNIASDNDEIRKLSIAFTKSSIDLAHAIDIDFYSLHAGYAKHYAPSSDGGYFIPVNSKSISPDAALLIMYDSLSQIKEYAAKYKVTIGIENLFPFGETPEDSLLCTPEDIFAFLDSIAQEECFGFLLDLGHLNISANYFGFDPDEFIGSLKKNYNHKILEIHLSGNDGKSDQHGPLSPDCWQLKAAQRFNLKKIPVTLECRGLKAEEISYQYQMVKRILEGNIQQCYTT